MMQLIKDNIRGIIEVMAILFSIVIFSWAVQANPFHNNYYDFNKDNTNYTISSDELNESDLKVISTFLIAEKKLEASSFPFEIYVDVDDLDIDKSGTIRFWRDNAIRDNIIITQEDEKFKLRTIGKID